MITPQTRQRILLAAAMAVTLWLVVWVGRQDAEGDGGIQLVQPQARNAGRSASPSLPISSGVAAAAKSQPLPVTLDWSVLAGRIEPVMDPDTNKDKSGDLFKSHSWYVPPSPQLSGPPPEPVAPAAPFIYLGKMEDTPQGTLLFLSGNNKVYSVAIGENIDKTWRLDAEDANTLRLTYLPLSLPQTLSKTAKS